MNTPLPLEYKEQPNPPPRPRANAREFWVAAVSYAMSEIASWSDGEIAFDDTEAIGQVVEACRRARDGYGRAKHLDDTFMWSPDSQLVEILDSLDTYREHTVAVKAWVEANVISPKYGSGTRVIARGETGTITSVLKLTAHYVVQTDAWIAAHPGQPPTCGCLVPYEDVEEIA